MSLSEMKTHSATARVTVTIEISMGDNWGGDCSVAQVHQQAIDGAEGFMRRIIEKEPRIRIVGPFKPLAVLVLKGDPT